MEVLEILKKAVEMKASDIFIVAGLPLTFKVQGVIEHVDSKALMPPETSEIIDGIYSLTNGRSIDGFLDQRQLGPGHNWDLSAQEGLQAQGVVQSLLQRNVAPGWHDQLHVQFLGEQGDR